MADGEDNNAPSPAEGQNVLSVIPTNTLELSENSEQDEQTNNNSLVPANRYDYSTYEKFFRDLCDEANNDSERDYKLEYKEIVSDSGYQADLVRKNKDNDEEQNTTHITINDNNKVVMNATKADNSKIVPDQDRFDDLVELAHNQGMEIKFCNISTPEYAARLYLACIKHKPPVKMIEAWDIHNDEFKGKIEESTLQQIEICERISAVRNHGQEVNNNVAGNGASGQQTPNAGNNANGQQGAEQQSSNAGNNAATQLQQINLLRLPLQND